MVDPSDSGLGLPYSYALLPPAAEPNGVIPAGRTRGRPVKISLIITSGLMLTALLVSLLDYNNFHQVTTHHDDPITLEVVPRSENGSFTVTRGKAQGVSEKASRLPMNGLRTPMYDWSEKQLSWQRTAYHFQPEKNWMNGN